MTTYRLTTVVAPELLDALRECLLAAGAGALEELPSGFSVYASDDRELDALRAAMRTFKDAVHLAFPDLEAEPPEVQEVSGDWQGAWLAHLKAEQVTETWVLRPTHQTPAPRGEHTLWLEPRPSFGEGGHATTRLAARAVERLARAARPTVQLLDVGTGSGALALVAVSSGFQRAIAVDIDRQAVDSARRNVELNGLAHRIDVRLGSARDVAGVFPVVVANILATSLTDLASDLAEKVAPGGTLVLSGLLIEDATQLSACYESRGLVLQSRETEDDWVLLLFRRGAATLGGRGD